jgi:glycosyltransferase involved in cell wall biosynthesis
MAKPRVIVDARMVGPTGHGIGNYVQDIAAALRGQDLPYELVFLIAPDCPADSVLREYEHAISRYRFLAPREILGLSSEIARLRPSLFHSPSFSSLWSYPCPVAFTVHDLNHLHFAGLFHRAYYRALLLPALRRARAVASVSETAAGELDLWLRNHGVKQTVRVVPNSIRPLSGAPAAGVLHRYGLSAGNYFLCLSNPKPHKNLEFLKAAYGAASLKRKGLPPLALSIAGEASGGIVHLGSLPGEAIPALLANARAFFFPSLYEGFGRPPVEAALAGTVPICAEIPVLREALSGVREARFLDPTNIEAWATEIARLSQAEPVRVSSESQAWINTAYSLAAVAKEADGFYRDALAGSPESRP